MQNFAPLTLERIKSAVSDIAAGYDVLRVYLFGSYAQGRANELSDVDLCLETGPTFSLFSAGGFASEAERRLNTSVDVVTERSLYPHVRESAMRDRVLVYERV